MTHTASAVTTRDPEERAVAPSRSSASWAARRIGSRLVSTLATVVGASFAVFALVDLAPGDVASRIAGDDASPETIERIRLALGLDEPFLERYLSWLLNALQGDLGTSIVTGQEATEMIAHAIPATASLIVLTAILSLILSMVAGLLSAIWSDAALDRIVVTSTSIGLAIPNFWLGLVLVSIFAVQLRMFPAVGYAPMSHGFGTWLSHLILPSVALSGVLAAELTRQLRGSLRDTLREPYIQTARMKGLSNTRIVGKHALKNAAIPMVTVFGVRITQLLGGTVVVERVFSIDGLGNLIVTAVQNRDMEVVVAVVIVFTLMVVVANTLVDLSYGYFNPRVRR